MQAIVVRVKNGSFPSEEEAWITELWFPDCAFDLALRRVEGTIVVIRRDKPETLTFKSQREIEVSPNLYEAAFDLYMASKKLAEFDDAVQPLLS